MRLGRILAAASVAGVVGCGSDPATAPRGLVPGSMAARVSQRPDSVAARLERATKAQPSVAGAPAGSGAVPWAYTIVRIAMPSAWGVAVRRDGTVAITNVFDASVTFVDVRSKNILGTVATGAFPTGIAFSNDGNIAYVACQGGTLDIIDVTKMQRLTSVVGFTGYPYTVLPAKSGADVFVGTDGGTIHVMNAATKAITARAYVGNQINGMAIDSSGTRLYATDMAGGRAIELQLPSLTVGRTWTVGGRTQGVAVDRQGSRLIVLNEYGNATDIDLATGIPATVASSIPAFGLADAPTASRMFWTGPWTGNVQMYHLPASAASAVLSVGSPVDNRRAAFHLATKTLIVTDSYGSVAFIN